MPHSTHRIFTFDLLRGIAVMTMVLAHSVYFFHSRDNPFLLHLENFGNSVSFVTFLVVSGAVAWVAYFGSRVAGGNLNRGRVLSRIALFLFAYYVLALIVAGQEIMKATGYDRLRSVFDILAFRHLPGFTEYFPPFIFYSALLALFPRLFAIASRSLKNVAMLSLLAFMIGFFIYQLPVEPFWRPWVALFSGGEGLYRFPLLQYFPVFLLGLHWGHETVNVDGLRAKRRFAAQMFGWFAGLAAAALGLTYATDIAVPTMFSRWPPSIPFLALGLAFAFFAATVLYWVKQLRSIPLLRDFLLVLGQNAIGIFWAHIFLLTVFAAVSGQQASSIGMFALMWLVLLVVSVALTTFLPFNLRFSLTAIRRSHEEHEEALEQEAVFRLSKDVAVEASQGLGQYFLPSPTINGRARLKKRHQLGIMILSLATAALVIPAATEEIAVKRQARGADVWWSSQYAYRQKVTLLNSESFVTIQPGTPAAITFDHRFLVDQGKSRADGQDIRLVYWTGAEHIVTDSTVVNPSSPTASLRFNVPAKISGGDQEQFYALYYGGFVEAPAPAESVAKPETTILARFEPEEAYSLVTSVSKTWDLIGQPGGGTIIVNLTSTALYANETVTYRILDTGLAGPMLRSSDTSWEAEISVSSLPPGAYRVQATLTAGDKELTSHPAGFYRSYPLYVAWTQDWEGYDVSQRYLEVIESIATQYRLPMTHFFNPRIFVTDTVSPARARTLTRWIQRRIELGDGFGLHLHMQKDLVEHSKIEPKDDPNWGDRGDGYGVPLAAYSKDEQVQLIRDANNLLFANGLPKATMFRAGGWFANLDTLAALEELGFAVDSSARTKYSFGRNRLPGYWNISPTMRPYFPSRTDQNRPGTSRPFPILEIPNNGADSYAFSAAAMIERFTDNLGQGFLTSPQQVTYLSHPHWFDEKEQARVRELFDYISRYAFAADHGPVLFVRTEDIAQVIWTHAE